MIMTFEILKGMLQKDNANSMVSEVVVKRRTLHTKLQPKEICSRKRNRGICTFSDIQGEHKK